MALGNPVVPDEKYIAASSSSERGTVWKLLEHYGLPVLVFRNDYDGEIYLRRLYCLNGWLWESFTAEEYGFEEEMGESLVAVRSFEPEVNGNLLTARIVTPEGQRQNVSVYLWAGGAKE